MKTPVAAAAAVVLAAATTVAVQVASPPAAQAAATHSSAGMYESLSPTRILNTTLGAHAMISLHVLGAGGIPGSNVSAVAIALQVANPAAVGYITAWPGSTRPTVSNLNFAAGQHVTNLAIIPVGTGGNIQLYNGSAGSVQLLGDAAGYVTGGTPVNPGAFMPIAPTRFLAGTTVAAHATLSLRVAGVNGVPSDAAAVAINVMAYRPTAAGYLTTFPHGQSRPSASSLNFGAGQQIANLAVVPLGSGGEIDFYNGSNGSVQVFGDVAGYYLAGAPIDAGSVGGLFPARILNTTAGVGHSGAIPAHGSITLQVAGAGGVPATGVSAVVVNLMVYQPGAPGYLTAWPSGTRPSVSSVTFAAGQQVANLSFAQLSPSGALNLYNGSNATVQLFADVFGYVLSSDTTVPNATVSHYVADLSGVNNSSASGDGCVDAKTTPGLVLLQVGAQTITSLPSPGVAMSFAGSVPRVVYATLVNDLKTYLADFKSCLPFATTTTIAIGTNNDGAFTGPNAYSGASRGADWANDVIDPLASYAATLSAGITIAGADDIEAGFASSYTDAYDWVTNFLSNTSASLIYNGSLDNCPTTFNSLADCGPVRDHNGLTKTWTRADYAALTYGLGPGRIQVLPQVYFDGQAMKWTNVDITSGTHLAFAGSLTQFADTNCQADPSGCGYTPEQGWASLRNALAAINQPPGNVATDLRIG